MTKTTAKPVSKEAFDKLFQSVSNWNRWGPDDEKGTLNYIRPEHILRAAGLVHKGLTVSMAAPIDLVAGPIPTASLSRTSPPMHRESWAPARCRAEPNRSSIP